MSSVDLKGISSLIDYAKSGSKKADADSVVRSGNIEFATGNFFEGLQNYANIGNSQRIDLSQDKYFANGNTILMQDVLSGKIIVTNILTGTTELKTAAELGLPKNVVFGQDELSTASNPQGFKAGAQNNGKLGVPADDVMALVKGGAKLDQVKQYLVTKFGSEEAAGKQILGEAAYNLIPAEKKAQLFGTISEKLTAQIEQQKNSQTTTGDIVVKNYTGINFDVIDRSSKEATLNSLRTVFGDQGKTVVHDYENSNTFVQTDKGIKVLDPTTLAVRDLKVDDAKKYFPNEQNIDVSRVKVKEGKLTYTSLKDQNVTLTATGVGDPHYQLNGVQAFDHQQQGVFTLLDGEDVTFYSVYKEWQGGDLGSRVSGAQIIELKGTDIQIVTQSDGTVTFMEGGKKLSEAEVAQIKKEKNITITKSGQEIKFNINGREIKEYARGGYMEFAVGSLNSSDSGLILEQMRGADEADGKVDGWFDLDKDGTKDNNEVYNLNASSAVYSGVSAMAAPISLDQSQSFIDNYKKFGAGSLNVVMQGSGYNKAASNNDTQALIDARTAYAAVKSTTMSDADKKAAIDKWVTSSMAALEADYAASGNSSGFVEGRGYTRSQWNEYVLTRNYAADSEQLKSLDGALSFLKEKEGSAIDQNIDAAAKNAKLVLNNTNKQKILGNQVVSQEIVGKEFNFLS